MRDELLRILQVRFEENMERHNGIKWEEVKKTLVEHQDKMKIPFLIVLSKVQRGVEVFAMTRQHWKEEKRINHVIAQLLWQRKWE